jgi:hypothetical protein
MNHKLRTLMKLATTTLGLFTLSLVFAPDALAGCGNLPGSVGAFNSKMLSSKQSAATGSAGAPQPGGADIVGMWEVDFVATNLPGAPPEGVPIDHGYSQWHSDGTEIMNSSRPPATGNFCLGVWKKTGPSSYSLNHRGLSFYPDGSLEGPAEIRESVVVDRSGNFFSGKFTIDQFDTFGNLEIHIEGVLTGTRIRPD